MAKKVWLFFVYLIVAVYTLNMGLNFVSLPDAFLKINQWVLVIAAVLLVIESFKYLREFPTY
ncbi:MAG: hypothetical protein Q8O84_00225 [Nanoarchaeota archaeon]|nr:hypothetical protein [Nanoarchaeota archaeon]MDP3758342.1 hypothetical protein [Candidatus Daviesbacteria bacterium]